MKFLITLILATFSISAFSQNADAISNSLTANYQKLNPTLIYSYNNNSQTHDYSNNWDFDADGINDEVYFVGTGGAHLYYFLNVVLSTDKKPREFKFASSDLPILVATDTANFNQIPIGFVVTKLGTNTTPSIILRLDKPSYLANKRRLIERAIMTKNIIISFVDGKTKYGSL